MSDELTSAGAERLTILIEECGEVIQAATKVLRHGWTTRNPVIPISECNKCMLEKEIAHLSFVLNLMVFSKDVSQESIYAHYEAKAETIENWLHYNKYQVRAFNNG